jgi:uncharacterized protein YbdZ (MbtH family)
VKCYRFLTSSLLALALLAGLMGGLPTPTAYAVDITVTANSADVLDAAQSDCAAMTLADLPGPNGETSLREAICVANNTVGADTITLPAGTYPLSIAHSFANPDDNSNGDLDITDDLTITGAGAATTIVDGAWGTPDDADRILHVVGQQTGPIVTITGVTIQDGYLSEYPARGGGIRNEGDLTLQYVTVMNNVAEGSDGSSAGGGGIYNAGTLTVENSTISGNTALGTGSNWGFGGGIQNDVVGDRTGGGQSRQAGTLTILNSTISGNTAQGGTDGGNGGLAMGGGLANCGPATVEASAISGNTAQGGNGGANLGGDAQGGGIGDSCGTEAEMLVALNCTISGNTAQGGTGEVSGDGNGGGLFSNSFQIKVSFTTIAGNSASTAGGGVYDGTMNEGNVMLKNTIVGDNTSPAGPDIYNTIRSYGWNLVEDTSDGTLDPVPGTGDITGQDPNLGALALNPPGNTDTQALLSGSPAINTAEPACTDIDGNTVTADQRGIARPQGPICDIGAYEVEVFSLGDLAWYDTNQDGIQDAGEPGVQGVTVNLYQGVCTGQALASTTTDASGNYLFADLFPDTYCLQFSNIPAGWSISPQNQGGDDAVDSDADPTTARITNISLSADDDSQDVGMYAAGSIGDRVFCDANYNNTFDTGEGVTGVAVTLYDDLGCAGAAGSQLSTQDSGTDGAYLFDGLPVGLASNGPVCYVVEVDETDTALGSCDNPITPLFYAVSLDTNAPDDLDNDFGFSHLLSLGDLAWYDTNQDGIQDAGEPGVPNIAVGLYVNTCSGEPIASDTTDANGGYLFTDQQARTYCLQFSNIPAGWSISPQDQGADDTVDSDADPTTAQIADINLTADDNSQDAGMYAAGSIGDRVFCDANYNNTFDAGEGVTGVAVTLYDDLGCAGAAGSQLSTQDSGTDGAYLFDGLQVGLASNGPVCYVVEVDETDSALGSCDNPITPLSYAVSLDTNAPDDLDNDFGFSQLLSLGDRVWYDTNQDGIQDAGELGVQGINVALYQRVCTGQATASTTTNASGNYLFTDLLPGTYCLQFSSIPAGWSISPQDQGGDDTVDSDADPSTGQITNINLTESDLDEDMGLYAAGSIGDRVWCDTDGNGAYNAGEGVAGVTISLYADPGCDGVAGTLLGTQDTTGDGEYLFTGLAVGPSGSPVCYVVRVDVTDMGTCSQSITPIEYSVSLDTVNPDDLGNDFGFQEPAPNMYTLIVTKAGAGSGTVTSSPAGINCGGDCNETYEDGTIVNLAAVADPGSTFGGWSGDADCSDGQVTMTADRLCTATFNLIPVPPPPFVPEASTLLLLGSGIAGLAGYVGLQVRARRRRDG